MEEEQEITLKKRDINHDIIKVEQEQIHGLLFGDKLSWQSIIYDLINTEQLDPWDIDISLLSQKYLEKVRNLEEADFFVSSKVLMAASLLLRMKSEILLYHYIPTLNELLFGKKEEKKYSQKRIELDEEIPELVAKTPLPRFRKVTLDELMQALGKAINTENRRIKRIVIEKQYEYEAAIAMPKNRINIKDQIKKVYTKLKDIFSKKEEKLAFSEIAGVTDQERISTFIPLLHLDNQHKVWLEQEKHFDEIWILLKHIYEKQNAAMLEQMRRDAEEHIKELSKEESERAEKIEKDFEKPLGDINF
ncbi:segregation/condensation protein A [Candidatus Pacearchaeota archaeon]|nr:segregation/condensation protein A [Candidatus Pacearchaeota archaeon]